MFSYSLKLRLGLGAALLGGAAFLSSAVLYTGMARVSERLEAAVDAEQRIARYSSLSTKVSSFLVIATEAVQTGLLSDIRTDRIAPIADNVQGIFVLLRRDLEVAVEQVRELGIDQQSRYATQSLGIARMEALLNHAVDGLKEGTDQSRLRAYVDTFASGFDPLLSQAVNTEVLFRNEVLASIEDLRRSLTLTALSIAVVSVLLVFLFYFGLVRPQFLRLDRLRDAARRIGQEDFALVLPESEKDEIGRLYMETAQTARALSARRTDVQRQWATLNETIEQRTQELRAANATLAEIDQNRRRFFADVSHELRTPLTVILMEAQIGQKGVTDPEASFATIESRAARLNRRIDDMLRVARSESGQLRLEPETTVLATIILAAKEEVSAEVESAGMGLHLSEIPDVTVFSDPNWLRQIIVGLVRNAIRHAREGKLIRIDPLLDDTGVGVLISDNGPGLAAPEQSAVFDRFAQSGTQKSDGFGIGLALSRWIMEEQHGQITLCSPVPNPLGPNPGLQVSLRLPRNPE